MPTNTPNQMPNSGESMYEDYSVLESSYESFDEVRQRVNTVPEGAYDPVIDNNWVKPFNIPLEIVRTKILNTKSLIEDTIILYEEFLNKIYVNPFLNADIEESHFHIWREIKKNHPYEYEQYLMKNSEEGTVSIFDQNGNIIPDSSKSRQTPEYASYQQYKYAEKHGCRACRKFVKEYDRLISHSSFMHIYDYRYLLTMLMHEINCINESLIFDFGEEYEDESQEQAAEFYFSWAKMAENHTRILAEQVGVEPAKLPASEVDHITQKQAAQFQAFFSIRVASYSETIDNLLFSLQKDLVDTCDTFYKRYVSPAIRFKTKVAAPLEFEVETTSFLKQAPVLSEEVITVINAMRGNFGSILVDMIQRRNNVSKKFDYFLSISIQRRKYVNYIDQLSTKGAVKPNVILDIKDDPFEDLFRSIYVDPSEKTSLQSSHKNLDNLLDDDHPQYLLRAGGLIEGNIDVAEGVTIDGVDISSHSHTGDDGSVKILASDIDYDTVKNEQSIENENNEAFSVSINTFTTGILTGGIPVVDVSLEINVDDLIASDYEYEIIYKEN